MTSKEFKELQGMVADIETVNHLEQIAGDNNNIQFVASFSPRAISFCGSALNLGGLATEGVKLSKTMNTIVIEALREYRKRLEQRMASLEINDTSAMPITDGQGKYDE